MVLYDHRIINTFSVLQNDTLLHNYGVTSRFHMGEHEDRVAKTTGIWPKQLKNVEKMTTIFKRRKHLN